MGEKILARGRRILFSQQSSILSAATTIMLLVVASRVLGLVGKRVLAHYFNPNDLSLFFAAFRFPDLIFETVIFGTFSATLIPIFASTLKKRGAKTAWTVASSVVNIGLIAFLFLAGLIILFADQFYAIFAPGYLPTDRQQIASIAKILFLGQGFFVVSYVLTGVLESMRRFLVPALAPLFYNLGIILGTVLFSKQLGLMAPALGVVIGAFAHFAIQLPLATKLGFRFKLKIKRSLELKEMGKLSLPRLIELSVTQIVQTAELFLASLISTASYTYFTLGNSLQLIPVSLFGTSIAKATLPTLSMEKDHPNEFKKTLLNSLNQMIFFVAPLSTLLIVLRIPVVRLAFGTSIFNWNSTVQTGMVVSAYGLSIVFQSAVALLARAFYALHNTKLPVIVSVGSLILNIILDIVLIKGFHLPAWGLALGFSIAEFLQAIVLFTLLFKKLDGQIRMSQLTSIVKTTLACFISGSLMFFLLKIFDRAVWVRRLSFLGRVQDVSTIHFEKFVLDTNYTFNLIILSVFVACVGAVSYLLIQFLLGSRELGLFLNLVKNLLIGHKVAKIPIKEESVTAPEKTP